MDGSLGKSSQAATDFTKNLSKNITIPITMWDERLSSEAVFKISKKIGSNSSNRVKKLDENAAAFILQGVIDFFSKGCYLFSQLISFQYLIFECTHLRYVYKKILTENKRNLNLF